MMFTLYIHSDNIGKKSFVWDESKNARLKRDRGVGFEEVVEAVARDGLLWATEHPRPERYPGQFILAVAMRNYVFIVPCEVRDELIQLKTIYPSRKAAREWRRRKRNEKKGQNP